MDAIRALFEVDRWIDVGVQFLPKLVAAVVVLLVFWGLYLVTAHSLRAIFRRAGFQQPLIRMLVDNVFRFTLIAIAITMAASQLGVNVAAALTGLGIAGIAVGFAAQESLANVIAGFLIFWDKPFRVGDFLTVEDQYGRVTEITMRSTRIRTQENAYVVIPNKNIIDSVVINHTKHGELRVNVPIGIAYKENILEARKVLLGAIEGIEGILEDPAPDVVTTELGGSSVNLLLRVWIDEASQERPTFFRVLEAAKLALDEADIEIPFPHLQLFVENVEDRVWDKLPALVGRRAGGES